jgi:hypothetical protein
MEGQVSSVQRKYISPNDATMAMFEIVLSRVEILLGF